MIFNRYNKKGCLSRFLVKDVRIIRVKVGTMGTISLSPVALVISLLLCFSSRPSLRACLFGGKLPRKWVFSLIYVNLMGFFNVSCLFGYKKGWELDFGLISFPFHFWEKGWISDMPIKILICWWLGCVRVTLLCSTFSPSSPVPLSALYPSLIPTLNFERNYQKFPPNPWGAG